MEAHSFATCLQFKTVLSPNKVLTFVFCDRRIVILVEFIRFGQTVNAERYYEILQNLQKASKNKGLGMLTRGIIILKNNARPHTARITTALLEKFGWDVLDHPLPPHTTWHPVNFFYFRTKNGLDFYE